MNPSTEDRADAAVHVTEFVAGYASSATRAAYGSDLSLWLAYCRGQSRALFEVRWADIEGYARHLEATGLAPATVNRRLATSVGPDAHPTRPIAKRRPCGNRLPTGPRAAVVSLLARLR